MRVFHLILLFLLSQTVFSQIKIQNLYFNSTQNILRLNFGNLPPTPVYTGIGALSKNPVEPNIGEGIAHAEDTNGNIIIWVNSNGVYDKNGALMPGSADILADPSSTEIVICPKPGTSDQFYIFYNGQKCSTLFYALVDLKQRGGLGDVVTKNSPIDAANTFAEGLEIIKIPCTNNYWLIAYQCSTGFKRFRISGAGISPGEMAQALAISNSGAENNFEGRGELDYHNGKIGYAINGKNRAYVAEFNPELGSFANGRLLSFTSGVHAATNGMYGLEFSPDASKVYFTDWYNRDFFGDIVSDNLFSYDFVTQQISSWRIAYKKCSSADVDGLGQIELGRDGKLYIPHVNGCQITVIENPNAASPAFSTLDVNTVLSTGISDHIQSDIFEPIRLAASKTSICLGESVTLTVTGGKGSYRWLPAVSNAAVTTVSPQQTTLYRVYAQNQFSCDDSAAVRIEVKNVQPNVSVTEPSVCGNASVVIRATPGMDSYQWLVNNIPLTGKTDSVLTATESGTYKVRVQSSGCSAESEPVAIEVDQPLAFKVPNFFSPDNDKDQKNETFKVVGYRGTIQLIVCNRWGQEVYRSDNYQNDWRAENLPDGVYYYYLTNVDNCFTPIKGWVHVLRGPDR
jgi:hypothetical protein